MVSRLSFSLDYLVDTDASPRIEDPSRATDKGLRGPSTHTLRLLPFGSERDLELNGRRLGIGRLKMIELVGLLALNPAGIPRSEITARLFPDSEPRQAGNYFRQVTHKLREATGVPTIRRNPNLVALADNVTLSSTDTDLEVMVRNAQLSVADIPALRAALDQVPGRYLETSSLAWAEQRRNRMDVVEEQARLTLALLLLEKDDFEGARDQCEFVLTRNRYSDSAYRLLVSVERQVGTEVSCLAVYRRAADSLREIGLRPGDARRLFHRGVLPDEPVRRTA